MPGVVSFVDFHDVLGINSVTGQVVSDPQITEEIFSSGHLYYAGQAIGLIVADTQERARKAAKAVVVTYMNQDTPVLEIRDAMKMKGRVQSYPQVTKGKKTGEVCTRQ